MNELGISYIGYNVSRAGDDATTYMGRHLVKWYTEDTVCLEGIAELENYLKARNIQYDTSGDFTGHQMLFVYDSDKQNACYFMCNPLTTGSPHMVEMGLVFDDTEIALSPESVAEMAEILMRDIFGITRLQEFIETSGQHLGAVKVEPYKVPDNEFKSAGDSV